MCYESSSSLRINGTDALPPTQAALIEHTKRAIYQDGHSWEQMMIAAPEFGSPTELEGW